MRRKPTSFDEFIHEVDEETRAAGPDAVALARALRDHFRAAVKSLRRRKKAQKPETR